MELTDLLPCDENIYLKAVDRAHAPLFLKIVDENKKYFEQFDFIAPQFESVQEIEQVIDRLMKLKAEKNGASYGLWKGPELIGLMTINHVNWKKKEADVGYWIIEKATGHGYATKAFSALVRYCFEVLDLKTLTAHTATTNIKSQKILKKMGFKETMTLKERVEVRGRKVDDFLFKLKRKKP